MKFKCQVDVVYFIFIFISPPFKQFTEKVSQHLYIAFRIAIIASQSDNILFQS